MALLYEIYKKIIKKSFGTGLGKFRFIRIINDSIISSIKPDFIEIRGHKMVIDSLDNLYLDIFKTHDEFETKFVERIIKKGDIVIDVGAHMGYYSLLFAKLVGKEGKIFAFEPDPKNFSRAEKNIKLNNYTNVLLTQKAVSDKTGDATLYLGDLSGGNSIMSTKENQKKISIKSVKLDDFFEHGEKKIDFVKLDAEGFEYAIIHGMESILSQNKELVLLVEFYPELIKKAGVEPIEYIKLLDSNGFELYELDEKNEEVIALNDFKQIIQKYSHPDLYVANLLCFRGKSSNEIKSYLTI